MRFARLTAYVAAGLANSMSCVILVAQSRWAQIKGRMD